MFRIDHSSTPSDGLKLRGNNFAIGNVSPTEPFIVAVGTTELMRVASTGRIGIGTAAPNNKLEITHGTAGNSGLRFTNLTSSSTA